MEISRFENLFFHSQSPFQNNSKNVNLNSSEGNTNNLNSASFRMLKAADDRAIEDLKKQDREIREHEQAHYRAAAGKAFAPQYVYTVGPDGNQYAVKGTTKILLEEGKTPEETIANANTAKNAAMAPNHPSDQDRRVILEATRMEQNAKRKILASKKKQTKVFSKKTTALKKNDGEPVLEKPIKNTANIKLFGMKLGSFELDNYKKNPTLKEYSLESRSLDKILKKSSSSEYMVSTLLDLYA